MRNLPPAATLTVVDEVADGLHRCVARLPAFASHELCSTGLQIQLCAHIREAFPREFDLLVESMRMRLTTPPYVAHITGLRFDRSDLLFLILSSVFGHVADPYGQSGVKLIRRLSPARDRRVPGVGVLSEALHTDGTDSPEPNDVTCLLCVRPDQNGGGRTHLLDIDMIRASILPVLSAESTQVLTSEPVPWQIADAAGGGTVSAPVIADGRLRWLRQSIAVSVPIPIERALAEFEAVLAATTQVIDFAMSSASLLVMNNRCTLHARTSIPDRDNSDRLVLRTKVFPMCKKADIR